jgi:bifunctional DNA-binding transcriptional regulator/antitoxin component of YhaV-PrlF toxin-antitoxin module
MSTIVELDAKGRVLIPAEIRRKVKSKRFRVRTNGNVVELEPLEVVEALRGKFRHIIKHDREELEEMGEEFVAKR